MAGFDLGRVIGAVLSGGAAPRRRSPIGYGRRAPTGNAQLGRALAGLAGIAIEALRRSQSAPPAPAAPPPRPAPSSGKEGSGFDWAGPSRQAPTSAPPVKKTPGQGGLKDAPPGAGPWGKAPGAAKPIADPWAPVAAEPEEEPSAETAEALLMLRAMIAAAKADGAIDAEERGRIASQLDGAGLSAAARDTVLADFDKPLSPAALAKLAGDPMLAAQIYAAAVVGAGEIAAAERTWLDEFAKALKLDRAAAAAIEARLL
jgi:tellurite resistance protein